MKQSEGKIRLTRLAHCQRKRAEYAAAIAALDAEIATIYEGLAEGAPLDMRTQKRMAAAPDPEIPAVSDLDKKRALRALQRNGVRQRLGK